MIVQERGPKTFGLKPGLDPKEYECNIYPSEIFE